MKHNTENIFRMKTHGLRMKKLLLRHVLLQDSILNKLLEKQQMHFILNFKPAFKKIFLIYIFKVKI